MDKTTKNKVFPTEFPEKDVVTKQVPFSPFRDAPKAFDEKSKKRKIVPVKRTLSIALYNLFLFLNILIFQLF